jgi:hypothetical protein
MPSKLSQILTLIEAGITDAVPGVQYLRGPACLNEFTQTPRLIWVHTRDVPGPAVQMSETQHSRATVATVVEAHLRAPLDELEALEHALILATMDVADGSVVLGEITWFEPQNGNAPEEACVVPLTFAIPVTAPEDETAEIETVDFDPADAVPGDGVVETGDE